MRSDSACGCKGLALAALTFLAVFASSTLGAAENPPADGFNVQGSDAAAIEVADAVMEAMGGREAWDDTRTLAWNFFGRRTHVWDKWTGDLRFQQDETLVLMNINTREGRAFEGGEEVTDPEQLAEKLKLGYEAWINDSYWLLMPYKLKDSGVTLVHLGDGTMEDGDSATVLQLTFEGVGVTPENKYHVYVDKDSGLVEQWAFFAQASDEEPRFKTPWANWTRHGNVMLSGDRGQYQLSDIMVLGELPKSVFESPEPVDLSTFGGSGEG